MTDSTPEYRYWAFISYSHKDEASAAWLHRALESYRLPKHIPGQEAYGEEIPRRLFPIFRDRDELPGSSDLGARLREALAASRSLIVVCSPQARQSKWVNEEIETFNRLGRSDRVFCVIVSGDPGSTDPDLNCLPAALRQEPLACDLRKGAERRHDAKLRLVAGIVGLPFDALKRRDRQRRRRLAIGGSIAAVLLLAGISVISWFGLEQRAMARARTLAAASVNATELEKNPVAGLKLAIAAAERSPTVEAVEALTLALAYQRSLVILEHNNAVSGASFSHDGRRILTCGRDAAARVWDVASGQVVHTLGEPGSDARTCVFSPDGSAIVTLPEKGSPLLWDSATGRLRKRLEGHPEGARLVRFSPTGKKILSADKEGIVRIWDSTTGRLEKAVQVSDAGVRAAFLVAGGTELVVLTQHGIASVWDWRAASRIQQFGETLTWVDDALVSPDGKRLLINNYQYRPYLWALSNPARFIDGAMAMPHVRGAAFSADSSTLALGGGDGFVTVFDATEGYQIKRLQHPDQVSSLAFSPDGRLLVTAADAIRIWSTPVLGGGVDNEIATLRGHAGWTRVVGFAPGDSSKILTIGSEDHTVRIWDISSPADRTASMKLGKLSPQELLDVARANLPIIGSSEPSQ
ncbi:MAG: TIR domain-containing protein [Desulfobacteraceae bacterium]